MNIWYFSAHDQPKGKSSRTYDFAYQLAQKGHAVTMFTNSYCHWTHTDKLNQDEKWRIETIDGIRVVWLKTFGYKGNGWQRGVNMLTNIYRLFQVTKTLSDTPDVIIGPSVPIGTGWAALRVAQKKGAAFVYEVRDVWPIALVDDGGMSKSSLIYHVFRYLEKKLYQKADAISSTLPFIFEHVTQSGADANKVVWIPNGVNFERFHGCDHYDGGKENVVTAMYVGGFGEAHDVITIVRAAVLLQQQGKHNIQFIIIGDGPKREACIQEANKHHLKNIEFRMPVEKSAVPHVQMEADILLACVLDSKAYRFGLNLNKLYDYFASGRPVIFSGNAPNDPVAESQAGYSIPPEYPEKLVRSLLNYAELPPSDRVAMGKRGQDYVKREFDMTRLGSKMESMLSRTINKVL